MLSGDYCPITYSIFFKFWIKPRKASALSCLKLDQALQLLDEWLKNSMDDENTERGIELKPKVLPEPLLKKLPMPASSI